MPVKADAGRASSAATASATRSITGERKGVAAELLIFVPLGHTAEVHELAVKNTGATPRSR